MNNGLKMPMVGLGVYNISERETDYAGRIRTKTIAKGNTLFCLAEHLHSYLKTVETMPENTFDEIVDKYVEMNAAHPFMKGIDYSYYYEQEE